MPSIGLGLAYMCYYWNVISKCLALMLMIIYAGPTSLQLLMICTAHKNQVENVSKIYLIMYATAFIPMAVWTTAFLLILYP